MRKIECEPDRLIKKHIEREHETIIINKSTIATGNHIKLLGAEYRG